MKQEPKQFKLSRNQRKPAKAIKLILIVVIRIILPKNTTETRDLITTINRNWHQNEATGLVNQGTRRSR